MSSIERAMDKLSGEEPTKPAAREQDEPADAGAAPAPSTAAEPEQAAPGEAAAEATPASVTAAEAGQSDEATVESAATSAAPSDDGARPGTPRMHIDFDRLAAGGFLVPGQAMTREAEEFQRIKRRLLGNLVAGIYESERPANLILITSSVPGEGKTFVSVNLAISIAMELDRTVLAIDTDIVKRDMSKVFGVVNRRGLFDLLADPSLRLEDLLVRTSISNLTVLPAGNRHANSTEMLASQRMRELSDEIAARYSDRVVLFDSPPVLAMTTATALAPLVGQLVIVAEAGATKQETIRETISRLENVRITGVVLNKSKQARAAGYDYYGAYGQTG